MFQFVDDELRTDIKNMMQAALLFPQSIKPEALFAPDRTATKVFDKLSRAVSVKHTLYNWRIGEATYLALLTRY